MKRFIEFSLEDGGILVVEVTEPESESGLEQVARPGEIASKASQTFEAALEKVKPAASIIITKLRELSDPPNEMTVEFGLKMNAEVGAVISAAGVEANYKVTLTWKRPQE